jgi:hypothetical protein
MARCLINTEPTTWEDELDALRRCSLLKARYLVDCTKAAIAAEFAAVHEELVALEGRMIKKHRPASAILTAMLDLARTRPMPALDTLRVQHGMDDSFGEHVVAEVVA